MFVFKSLNGLAPLYILKLLPPNDSTRALRSTDQSLLKIPQTNLKTRGDRSFSAVAPTLWNKLPPHVRASQTLPVFKSRLKTHLYSLAFGNQDWKLLFPLGFVSICCLFAFVGAATVACIVLFGAATVACIVLLLYILVLFLLIVQHFGSTLLF